MRRIFPILSSILIGALAVALGMGAYLHKANTDRERLAEAVSAANQTAADAQAQSKQAIEDANQKLAAANQEIATAQDAIKQLQAEQALMATAHPLTIQRPSAIKNWKEAVDLPIGVSMKYPPLSAVDKNDQQALLIGTETGSHWFSLTQWDQTAEDQDMANLSTSTPISYVVGGKLLSGWTGILSSEATSTVFVLKFRSGTSQFLIWARDPDHRTDNRTLYEALSTLNFQS